MPQTTRDEKSWEGRVAIVTGASSGIGAATAVQLAALGADVVGVARRADRLEDTMAACRRHRPASFGHVADGVVRMVERRLIHLIVPRQFGAVGALYPLAGRPMRWGIRRYASS